MERKALSQNILCHIYGMAVVLPRALDLRVTALIHQPDVVQSST